MWCFGPKAKGLTKGSDSGFLERGFICIICWFDLIFLNIPRKWNNLVSLRSNYFIFIGYLKKKGDGEGSLREPPDPLWIRHWASLFGVAFSKNTLMPIYESIAIFIWTVCNAFLGEIFFLSENHSCQGLWSLNVLYFSVTVGSVW